MQLAEGFRIFLKEHQLKDPSLRFLVAVSGGLDSAVLASLCYREKLSFSIVHCNFQLRDNESERDAAFVQSLGSHYQVPVFVKRFETSEYAASHKLSIQEAARELRYAWFEELRREHHFQYVLLAHQANDRIETLLMNFFRGTGLAGLTGIPEKTPSYCLRPLLFAQRSEIETYARENNLEWVEDSSNSSSKYTRNYFRNELIPGIKKVYPRVEDNLQHNIDRFQKIDNLYQHLLGSFKSKLIKKVNGEVHIPVAKLLEYAHTALVFEIIHDFGFGERQVEEVLKLCHAESGKYIANDQFQIIRHRRWLIIAPLANGNKDTIAIEKDASKILFSGGALKIGEYDAQHLAINPSPLCAQFDSTAISFPLLLRRWKEGDYFYPLGMPKKKKLARFLIDQKLSKTEKEAVWVLESASRIVWVLGYRIDHRARITDKTRNIIQVELTKLRP
jgi:tRNA(Ile)-lysidine synthase